MDLNAMTPADIRTLHSREYQRAYYAANKGKMLARAKAHYAANKQAKKEYDAAYRAENRQKLNERNKVWRNANLVVLKAKEAARRAANPELYAKKGRAWREKNADKLRAYEATRARTEKRRAITRLCSEAWKVAHPEERRNEVRNRRAKIKAGGVLSKDIEKRLMAAQKGKCPVCRVDIRDRFHLDHIFPVARGGRNVDENVQLLCPPCNQSKSDLLPEEFMQRRGMLL